MNYIRSSTQQGIIVRNCLTTLTRDNRGYLLRIVDDVGEAKVDLPSADGQLCQFTVEDVLLPTSVNNLGSATGNVSGGSSGVACYPLDPWYQNRVVLSGTCSGGAWLMAANGGKASAIGTQSGVWTIGVAEEDGVDGQYVLIRPLVQFKSATAAKF
jgi:hypothetical protein